MKKLLLFIPLLCACFSSTPSVAQSGVSSDFATRLRELSARIETIACDFTLVKSMSFLASDTESKGKFYYVRDKGISLEFTEPAGDRITMGPQKFRIVSGGRANVVSINSNPMLRQLQRMLTACMTGDVAMLEAGASVTYSETGEFYVVTIVPDNRRAKNFVDRMTLTFEKGDMSLSRLRMDEPSGDSSEYVFFNKAFNAPIDAARFDL